MYVPICPVSLRQSCQGPWPGLLGKVKPEDTVTRATGATCGSPRSGIPGWAPGGVGRTTGPGILGRAPHLPGSGFRYRRGPGAISEGSAATAAPGAAPGVCADPPPRHRPLHPNPASPAAPKPGISRTPGCTEPSAPAVSRPTSGAHPVPAVTGCALPPALTVSRVPPGCLRAPQIPGQLPRASLGPCPVGPQPSPEVVTDGGCRSPRRICLVSPLLTALRRSSGGARAGAAGRHRAGQGAAGASLHRYLGRTEPGPCSSWPTSHRCRKHRPALAQLPWGRSPAHRQPSAGGGGTVGFGVNGSGFGVNGSGGRWEQRVMGAARTCLNKVPPGRTNVRAGAGPKADAGLWHSRLS